ncbi:MAG: hypothetical protein V7L05_29115 [Nostoc sp.]|uniref:hypothetical protein n=1 Tax=Nostoc sp. TaxID=1180 RepID=UPI002FF5707B
MSRSQSPTGNAFREAPPQDLRQSRDDLHFQPLAGNEVLKGFWLKFTPMSIAVPLRHMRFKYMKTAVIELAKLCVGNRSLIPPYTATLGLAPTTRTLKPKNDKYLI